MLATTTINQSMNERLQPLRNRDASQLLVHEIYSSIQGESSHMGRPCVFVRTTACHLRCSYCDTEHAFFKGQEFSVDDVVNRVLAQNVPLVEITGGEPLLQPAVLTLFDRLIDAGLEVLCETSGAVTIAKVNRCVKLIVDVKTPGSGEDHRNVWKNLEILWPGCEVKFVISDRADYDYAKDVIEKYQLCNITHVLLSPVVARLDPKQLIDWIMHDRLPIRFQMQLHRVLYGEEPGK